MLGHRDSVVAHQILEEGNSNQETNAYLDKITQLFISITYKLFLSLLNENKSKTYIRDN